MINIRKVADYQLLYPKAYSAKLHNIPLHYLYTIFDFLKLIRPVLNVLS